MSFFEHLLSNHEKTLIIAEIAQAHDGSLGMAHAYIDAIAKTGANVVKFQTHLADEESSEFEPWRVKFSYQDKDRIDYWRRMEFTLEQWQGLKRHADEKGLVFLSSPFSPKSVEWLETCQVPFWKIASGEINNYILYESLIKTKKPVILSSGMSSVEELNKSVEYFRARNIELAIMQCTTEYPCKPENIGIRMVPEFKSKFDCPVGLSDHSGSIFPSLTAVTLGATLLEVHVTMSRDMFGPDVSSSITTEELKELVAGTRMIEAMLHSTYNKDNLSESKSDLRQIFSKSLVAKFDLKKGDLLTLDKLNAKKPMRGIPVNNLYQVLNQRCLVDIHAGEFITEDQLER